MAQNYRAFIDTLQKWGAKRALLVLVARGHQLQHGKETRDALIPHLVDRNDRLFVAEIRDAAWAGLNLMFDPSSL